MKMKFIIQNNYIEGIIHFMYYLIYWIWEDANLLHYNFWKSLLNKYLMKYHVIYKDLTEN